MIASGKPRYQRHFRFNAPMHIRQHFLHVHVDKALRAKLKLAGRTVQVSRGDTVKVMAGSKRGTTGKVTSVNLRTGRIILDSLSRKNARGKEVPVSVYASNVYVTDLNLSDKFRAAKLKVAQVVPDKAVRNEAAEKPAAKEPEGTK